MSGSEQAHTEIEARKQVQALHVDTNGESPNGRAADFDSGSVGSTPASPSKFNKNEYQCRYMREVYRPRLKAKKEAAK